MRWSAVRGLTESAVDSAGTVLSVGAGDLEEGVSTSSSSRVVWSPSPPRPMPSSSTTLGSTRTRSATPSRASRWAPPGMDSAITRMRSRRSNTESWAVSPSALTSRSVKPSPHCRR